jgi:diamine N-acetyltransferase
MDLEDVDVESGEVNPAYDAEVSLREVTAETLRSILRLKVAPSQEHFVANNAASIAEAHFNPEHAWFRAIYADETPVGFLMIYDDPDTPTYFLWRFMIDERYQGRGYGTRALRLLVEHVRGRPDAAVLGVSYVPGEGSPDTFYKKFGFEDTGEMDEDEVIAQLLLETLYDEE